MYKKICWTLVIVHFLMTMGLLVGEHYGGYWGPFHKDGEAIAERRKMRILGNDLFSIGSKFMMLCLFVEGDGSLEEYLKEKMN